MTKVITEKKKIDALLNNGVAEVIVRQRLEERLLTGRRLRVKLGIDPSGTDLTLGHAVVLRKLKEFQDLGHEIIFIIGSFTGMIGDPSGKTKTRVPLTEKDIKQNFKTYKKQAAKILDIKKVKFLYNHTWLKKLKFADILKIAGSYTVSQMLDRDMYQERIKKDLPISLPEFFYPLMQGYDSVQIKADVEIGGTDQLFNILAGRMIQKHFGEEEQDILTVPLLVGLDGKQKMSKSFGNYIALTDSPDEIFGKIMSIPDEAMPTYFELAVGVDKNEFVKLKDSYQNPRDLKAELAERIVELYYARPVAIKARENFNKLFQKRENPTVIPILTIKTSADKSIVAVSALGFKISKSEVARLIKQGGLKVNQEIVKDSVRELKSGDVVQKGKRHFFRVIEK